MTPPLIGLAGYARAGKDTVGRMLVDEYGYEPRAFADKLRDLAWIVFPDLGELVSVFGYEAVKNIDAVDLRTKLVALGAGAREVLGGNVWLDACLPPNARDPYGRMQWWSGSPTVVTDVRYRNEAQRIRDLGGVVIVITRPGIGPANTEEARTIAELCDAVPHQIIVNDGDLDDLTDDVRRLMEELG